MDNVGPGGVGMILDVMKTCARCGLRYDWRNSSTPSLKMTYCGTLCERYDLGFTLDALLKFQPSSKKDEAPTGV